MLSFFRRIINSKAGVIVTFIVLGVIAIAFAAGDVSNVTSMGGGIGGAQVAKVGDAKVGNAELRQAVNAEVEAYRREQPTLDVATFIAQGGLDGTLQRIVNGMALEEFGHDQGMVVSRRAVDGQIASIPALRGPNGQFDPTLYQRILADRKMTDQQVRTDIARELIGQQLIAPTQGATQMPQQLALPYASLLLEKRAGQIGFIPLTAVGTGAAPTPAEIQSFYGRNLSRYTLPERRTVRYAVVSPQAVAARVTPTDAEIAAYFRSNQSSYAASEKRTVTQVIVADQAGANALAAKVKGGTALAAAAQAAGLEPSTQEGVDKAAYAATTSAAVADAVFAAPQGAVVGPLRGTLGFVVARVDAVTQVPARTLQQVRADIFDTLTKQKSAAALADLRNKVEDALADNATFDEVVGDQKLQAQALPAVTAQGQAPDAPAFQPSAEQRTMITAAFTAEDGDAPQVVPLGQDGGFAVVAVGQVVPSAPRPLMQVQNAVIADLKADRARAAARKVANDVLARVNKGAALGAALGQTGLSLPAIRPIAAARAQLAAAQQTPAAAPLALLFSMKQGTTKTLQSPGGDGWYVIKLDRIDRGDASNTPDAVRAARADIGRLQGREYVEQFVRAVSRNVGVKIDTGNVAAVRNELVNGSSSNN